MKRTRSLLLMVALPAGVIAASSDEEPTEQPTPTLVPVRAAAGTAEGEAATGLPADALQSANRRGLSPADIRAAMMTYTPSGKMDDYYLFSSGGQSGNVVVIGAGRCRYG